MSNIDVTKPENGASPLKADFRSNFNIAKTEIEELQLTLLGASNSSIDFSYPQDWTVVSKAGMRANWTSAKSELVPLLSYVEKSTADAIDTAFPIDGVPSSRSAARTNFLLIKNSIENVWAGLEPIVPANSISSWSDFGTLSAGIAIVGLEFSSGSDVGIAGTNYLIPQTSVIEYFYDGGVRSLRLPIRWEYLQPTLYEKLSGEYLGYIKDILDYSSTKNQRVLIEMHNNARRYIGSTQYKIGSAEVPLTAFADACRRLGLALREDYGHVLYGYAVMGEPDPNYVTRAESQAMMQAGVNAFREVDMGTWLFINGWHWSNPMGWVDKNPNLHLMTDPANRLVFSMHQYFDHPHSGAYADGDGGFVANGGDIDLSMEYLDKFVSWGKAYGFNMHVGEFGAPNSSDWTEMLETFMQELHAQGIPFHMWGAFDPASGNILNVSPTTEGDDRLHALTLFDNLALKSLDA